MKKETLSGTNKNLSEIIQTANNEIGTYYYPFVNFIKTTNLEPKEEFFDVYFAIDIINAANNLKSVKYTDENSAFKKFAINIDNNKKDFINFLNETNFGYFSLNKNKIIDKSDFIRNFLNPFTAKNHLIGTSGSKDVEKIAKLALKLGYENTIVINSSYNLPFIVLNGKNTIAEAWKNKIFSYSLIAKNLDLLEFPIDDIKIKNIDETFEITKNVFNNKIKNAFYYTIIVNSAMSLYISKVSSSLMNGILLAKKTIDDGLACEKLNQIIASFEKFQAKR